MGWEVVDKQAFIYFLGGFLIFAILSPIINSKIYFFDKRLVFVLNIGTMIINSFILIAFSEILLLILH
jgi:hypothetical protein